MARATAGECAGRAEEARVAREALVLVDPVASSTAWIARPADDAVLHKSVRTSWHAEAFLDDIGALVAIVRPGRRAPKLTLVMAAHTFLVVVCVPSLRAGENTFALKSDVKANFALCWVRPNTTVAVLVAGTAVRAGGVRVPKATACGNAGSALRIAEAFTGDAGRGRWPRATR